MRVLAIDTSTTSGSVALTDDGRLVVEWTVGDVGVHALWLQSSISSLVESSGTEISEIDLFAATSGPGSFTGLRIGISAMKGLAWTLGRPVAGVSTLEALSMNLTGSAKVVCPVLDARKKEVYTALYDTSSGAATALLEDSAMAPSRLIEEISRRGLADRVIFLGSGLSVYGDLFAEKLPGADFAPGALWHPRASNVATLASREGCRALSAAEFTPTYLRKSEAELKAKKARENKV